MKMLRKQKSSSGKTRKFAVKKQKSLRIIFTLNQWIRNENADKNNEKTVFIIASNLFMENVEDNEVKTSSRRAQVVLESFWTDSGDNSEKKPNESSANKLPLFITLLLMSEFSN